MRSVYLGAEARGRSHGGHGDTDQATAAPSHGQAKHGRSTAATSTATAAAEQHQDGLGRRIDAYRRSDCNLVAVGVGDERETSSSSNRGGQEDASLRDTSIAPHGEDRGGRCWPESTDDDGGDAGVAGADLGLGFVGSKKGNE
jgi:hypothetical protein